MTSCTSFLTVLHFTIRQALTGSNIVQFNLGPTRAYLVSGSTNLKDIFRSSTSNFDNRVAIILVAQNVMDWSRKDVARLKQDTSGRGKKPSPGSEHITDRIFFQQHHIYNQFLTHPRAAGRLAEVFYQLLCENMDNQQSIGSSRCVGVYELLKSDVSDAAIRTLLGSRVFEQHPKLIETWWAFNDDAFSLFFGVPRFVNSRPYKSRERMAVIMEDWVRRAVEHNIAMAVGGEEVASDSDAFWDAQTGSRVSREMIRWFTEQKYEKRSITGYMVGFLFA